LIVTQGFCEKGALKSSGKCKLLQGFRNQNKGEGKPGGNSKTRASKKRAMRRGSAQELGNETNSEKEKCSGKQREEFSEERKQLRLSGKKEIAWCWPQEKHMGRSRRGGIANNPRKKKKFVKR